MTEIHSAHDKFFKQNLADIQIAKDFFKIHLPNEVILNILAISDESHALIYIKNTLYYIMNKANISDKIRFKKALEKISIVKDGEFMSTMAEEYINEGIKKGLHQGIPVGKKEGKLETIKAVVFKMLQSGMQYSDISKFTELSEEEIKNLDLDNF